MKEKTRKTLFYLSGAGIAVAIILMIMPFSTSLTFAPGPDTIKVVQYSYFHIMSLIGYANFFPPLTALSATLWFIVWLWKVLRYKRLQGRKGLILALATICFVSSVLALFTTITPQPLGYVICGVAATTMVMQFLAYK